MPRIYKTIIFFVLLIIFLTSNFLLLNSKKASKVKVGNTILKVEITDTPEKRSQGLSDRKSLCSDCGMLFVFNGSTSLTTSQPGIYSFWMRRMYFDIDILWIRNGEVVDITYGAKAPPKFSLTPSRCQAKSGECLNPEWEAPKTFYQSKVPVDMVLEVNSGWVKEKGIKVGDKVENLK